MLFDPVKTVYSGKINKTDVIIHAIHSFMNLGFSHTTKHVPLVFLHTLYSVHTHFLETHLKIVYMDYGFPGEKHMKTMSSL